MPKYSQIPYSVACMPAGFDMNNVNTIKREGMKEDFPCVRRQDHFETNDQSLLIQLLF